MVKIPFSVRIKNKLGKSLDLILKISTVLEIAFLSACIYVLLRFFGAEYNIWTLLASPAIYFIIQELVAYMKDIIGNFKLK